jgi:transcriptional regulator GlxA family with amidase domain
LTIEEESDAGVIVIGELWLAPDDDLKDRYSDLKEWLHQRYRAGSVIYSACSGAVLLAASGLLKGKAATSHWGYADLFRRSFPDVHFVPEPNIVFADDTGRIVTAGGATSWHDLAIHIISRHCGPGEALHIAKLSFAMAWRRPITVCEPRQAPTTRGLGRSSSRGLAPQTLPGVQCRYRRCGTVRHSRTQFEAPVLGRHGINGHRLCTKS